MTEPELESPAPQRLGRRTVLGGALAAVMAALAARRPKHDRRGQHRDPAGGQSAEPKRPIWIGHL